MHLLVSSNVLADELGNWESDEVIKILDGIIKLTKLILNTVDIRVCNDILWICTE